MRMILAIVLYVIIIFSFVQNWLFLTAATILLFSLKFNSMMLIPLAMLFDGYFGNFFTIPILSIISILWFVLVELLRPKFINFQTN